MNNQQQPPYVMVPFGGYPPPPPEQRHGEVPPRVRAALAFCEHLMLRTMKRAAMNDISIQEIEQREPTRSEALAHNAACDLLAEYFAGKMKPSRMERAELEQEAGTLFNCPACWPNPNRGCKVCGGVGQVLIQRTA